MGKLTRHWRRGVWVVLALGVAACGGSSNNPASSQASPTPNTTPSGPPLAKLTLTGAGSLAGAFTASSVTCQAPSLQGLEITVFGSVAGGPGVYITVGAKAVTARVALGSGASYVERDFLGTGVSSFNAAKGVNIDTSMTESTPTGNKTTGVPTLTHLAGQVVCNNQQPGGGAVRVSGDLGAGLSQLISPIRVNCLSTAGSPEQIVITGLEKSGTGEVFVEIGGGLAAPNNIFVVVVPAANSEFYFSSPKTGISFQGGVAKLQGTVEETVSGAAAAQSLTVSGTATCGSSVTP